MHLELLQEVALTEIGVGDDALDGPFVLTAGGFGLLVSLRGKDGGAMPSPAELHWRREVPPGIKKEPVLVFLRRGDRAVYLGAARVARRGKPATDGFKVAFGMEVPLEEGRWREIVEEVSAAPAPPPEEAVMALGPQSTTGERMAALRVFVERWFGGAEGPVREVVGDMPRALRTFYQVTAGRRVCVQNHLVGPEELAREEGSTRIIFYVENQGVCSWATEVAGDDPPVYVRVSGAGATWRTESDSLSSFLIELLLLEAAFGAPVGASHGGLDARALTKLAKIVRPVPLAPWAASRTRFFGGGGVVGFANPDGEDFSIWLGARDRLRMEPLERLLTDWPDVRF